jgi:hypothetical protein
MTTIDLQLEVTGISLVRPFAPPARSNIGFLSSIAPDPILRTAFLTGTGLPSTNVVFDTMVPPLNYDKGDIKNRRKNQKQTCTVIATVGGAITSDAVANDPETTLTSTYVSLVGDPRGITDPTIKGGVTLDSYKLNNARKEYLKGLVGGMTYTNQNIVLYTNKNSQMHSDEKTTWASDGTFVESAAGQTGGINDPGGFVDDFGPGGVFSTTGAQSGAKGLIISDDPFFRASRAELIKQVNVWLGGDQTRKVVYPSQIYGSPVLKDSLGTLRSPTSGQSILYGPDLIAAYHLLGTLARCCREDPTASPGFVSAVPFIVAL